jgi:DNA-binding response OmpR family regulator
MVDLERHTVSADSNTVTLTAKFLLLGTCCSASGRVLSRDVLLSDVWATAAPAGRAKSTSTCGGSAGFRLADMIVTVKQFG